MHSVKRILTTENRTCAIRPTAIQSYQTDKHTNRGADTQTLNFWHVQKKRTFKKNEMYEKLDILLIFKRREGFWAQPLQILTNITELMFINIFYFSIQLYQITKCLYYLQIPI